jgi:hypothetical protein
LQGPSVDAGFSSIGVGAGQGQGASTTRSLAEVLGSRNVTTDNEVVTKANIEGFVVAQS